MTGFLNGFKAVLASKTVWASLAAFVFALLAVIAPDLDLSRIEQIVSGILSMLFNGVAVYGRVTATRMIRGVLPTRKAGR